MSVGHLFPLSMKYWFGLARFALEYNAETSCKIRPKLGNYILTRPQNAKIKKQKGGSKAALECLCCEAGNPLERARDTSILQGVL